MKIIWIATIAICGYFKAKCPKECEVTVKHEHLIEVCRDSSAAYNGKKEMQEALKKCPYRVDKIDSLKIQ